MRRLWTPFLQGVYVFFFAVLFCFEGGKFIEESQWNKERLYRKLLSGPRTQQTLAARQLASLQAQEQLVRALQSDSPYVRRLATQGLWNLWLHAAGDEPFRLAEAARVAVSGRDYPKALLLLNKLVARYPNFAEGWNRRATLFWQLGQYELSIFDCEKVIALNPNHFPAWQGMGVAQLQLRDFRGACRSLRAALRISPHDPQSQQLLHFSEMILRRANETSDRGLLRI